MKILHLDYDDIESPWGGGQSVRTFEINRRLAQKHDITVVTNRFPLSKSETKDSVKYLRVGGGSYYFSFFRYMACLPFVIKRFEFDLLVEDFTVPFSTQFTPLMTRKPVIASVQALFANEASEKYKIPFFIVERIGLKFYQNFVVPTQAVRNRVLKHAQKGEVKVIPNGVAPEYFGLQPSDGRYLLFLGRIDVHQKGLDLLIEAFAAASQLQDIKLVIAGAGPNTALLAELVERYKVGDKVEIVGKVVGERKYQLLSNCLCVCIPSRYETSSLVLLESFASGKPVIAFDIDVMKELAPPECATLVKRFDIQDYREAIVQLLRDSIKRRKMGLAAREYAHRFEWTDIANEQERYYLEVLHQRH